MGRNSTKERIWRQMGKGTRSDEVRRKAEYLGGVMLDTAMWIYVTTPCDARRVVSASDYRAIDHGSDYFHCQIVADPQRLEAILAAADAVAHHKDDEKYGISPFVTGASVARVTPVGPGYYTDVLDMQWEVGQTGYVPQHAFPLPLPPEDWPLRGPLSPDDRRRMRDLGAAPPVALATDGKGPHVRPFPWEFEGEDEETRSRTVKQSHTISKRLHTNLGEVEKAARIVLEAASVPWWGERVFGPRMTDTLIQALLEVNKRTSYAGYQMVVSGRNQKRARRPALPREIERLRRRRGPSAQGAAGRGKKTATL